MATSNTPNLQLLKPDDAENILVQAHLNDNWDKIDTAYGNMLASITTILKARKTANQDVTNSTTLVPDTHLFVPVAANSVYAVTSFLPYNGAAAPAGGFKPSWVIPAGATFKHASYGVNGHAAGTMADYDVVIQAAAAGRTHGTNLGTHMSMRPSGTLKTTGTAGTFALWWAQATANGVSTTLQEDAWIMLFKF